MNEKLQYAEMLEIPVSTCQVTYRPPKKKKFSFKKKPNSEEIKDLVVQKVNERLEEDLTINNDNGKTDLDNAPILENSDSDGVSQNQTENLNPESVNENYAPTVTVREKVKEKFTFKKLKIGVVGIQLIVIGVLAATIFLTNALVTNSGINVFMRSVFGTQAVETIDNRVYTDFSPALPVDNFSALSKTEGVVTISGEESVYSPCDGVITSLILGDDGKYSMEITHNQNFKTTFSGLDYAYSVEGDSVYSTIPVGYVNGEKAEMCFFSSGDTLITDYTLEPETVVWQTLN